MLFFFRNRILLYWKILPTKCKLYLQGRFTNLIDLDVDLLQSKASYYLKYFPRILGIDCHGNTVFNNSNIYFRKALSIQSFP